MNFTELEIGGCFSQIITGSGTPSAVHGTWVAVPKEIRA